MKIEHLAIVKTIAQDPKLMGDLDPVSLPAKVIYNSQDYSQVLDYLENKEKLQGCENILLASLICKSEIDKKPQLTDEEVELKVNVKKLISILLPGGC